MCCLYLSSHARGSGTQNMMTENENIVKILACVSTCTTLCMVTFGQTVYFTKLQQQELHNVRLNMYLFTDIS